MKMQSLTTLWQPHIAIASTEWMWKTSHTNTDICLHVYAEITYPQAHIWDWYLVCAAGFIAVQNIWLPLSSQATAFPVSS